MKQVMGNVIVGQSGGPTAVINSSLAGVFKTAKDRGAKKVYGMLHGIQGLLEERVVDLSEHIRSDLDIDLLKRTPSSFLGSCRYKLPPIKGNTEVYDKIFEILEKLEVEYFFYIGGNDSMDTIMKLSDYAILTSSKIRFMGVPKTIDNDLPITDHTPGFGSAAKYIASITKEIIRDGLVYDQQNVTLVEIMGRNAGWLTGAAALAKGEDCEGPVSYTHLELAVYAGAFSRETIDASELVIGMKCGGSDGLSGITANPTVGAFSDLLISKGGTTILTEVPEMFGAETLLMNRCETPELFDKTVHLINDFKNYFTSHNQTIYENPSPGNKKGGISTLEDKSLGCTQKSGSAPVKGVLSYGEPVKVKGLNLLSAPGNDLVASTALAVSGAQIVLFTTGRGTPFASPVPTVKISSNSKLAGHKNNWIDFKAGSMVEDKSKEQLAQELFDYVLAVASGKKVKAEEAGFHDMAIFKQGVTL